MDNELGEILRGELSSEVEAKALELMALSEQRRQESMEQYKRDGITTFMRADGVSKVIEAEPMPSR